MSFTARYLRNDASTFRSSRLGVNILSSSLLPKVYMDQHQCAQITNLLTPIEGRYPVTVCALSS